jgi:hypothetical protein
MMKFALRSHQLFSLVEVKAPWLNDGAMVCIRGCMEYIRTHVMLPPGAKTSFKAYLEDQAVDLYLFMVVSNTTWSLLFHQHLGFDY